MNSKERVRLAFNHQEPDRLPLFELTIDNPTASHVLGRPTLCGFGGQARGVAQNNALLAGRIEAYHRQRVADEIELWQTLDLDVYPNAYPVPRHPAAPEQVEPNAWRFTNPATGQWRLYRYQPASDMYDEVDSSLRAGSLAELAWLTEALEANPPRLDDWDFSPVDTLLRELGRDRFVMGSAGVRLSSPQTDHRSLPSLWRALRQTYRRQCQCAYRWHDRGRGRRLPCH